MSTVRTSCPILDQADVDVAERPVPVRTAALCLLDGAFDDFVGEVAARRPRTGLRADHQGARLRARRPAKWRGQGPPTTNHNERRRHAQTTTATRTNGACSPRYAPSSRSGRYSTGRHYGSLNSRLTTSSDTSRSRPPRYPRRSSASWRASVSSASAAYRSPVRPTGTAATGLSPSAPTSPPPANASASFHEFKHVLDHTTKQYLYRDRPLQTAAEQAERVADYFAACLLMPKKVVVRLWCQGHQNIIELAARLQVSPAALRYRLDQLGLTDQDHDAAIDQQSTAGPPTPALVGRSLFTPETSETPPRRHLPARLNEAAGADRPRPRGLLDPRPARGLPRKADDSARKWSRSSSTAARAPRPPTGPAPGDAQRTRDQQGRRLRHRPQGRPARPQPGRRCRDRC